MSAMMIELGMICVSLPVLARVLLIVSNDRRIGLRNRTEARFFRSAYFLYRRTTFFSRIGAAMIAAGVLAWLI